MLGLALAQCSESGPSASPGLNSASFGPPTANVDVALHLDEPLAPDRTTVWTAAFQAAWDRMADTLGLPDGIRLAAPAEEDAVRALNRGRLTSGVVDPGDLTVIAGPATKATWAAIDAVSDRARPSDAPAPSGEDCVAFARLHARVRYAIPFCVAEAPLHFGARGVPVRAWGLRPGRSASAERMSEQVTFHLPAGDQPGSAVVVLTGAEGKRVVISGRPPRATLRETWRDVSATIADVPAQPGSSVDTLSIPRVAITAGRSYDEIAPATVIGTRWDLTLARQDLRLVVDERGAEVDSEAVIVAVGSIPRDIEISGPFLVALLAPGSDEPYVLAWIGSENGLVPWDAALGERLSPSDVQPFVGEWELDVERSIEATLAAVQRVLADSGTPVTRSQIVYWLRDRELRLDVLGDASAHVTQAAGTLETKVSDACLCRDGSRVIVELVTPDESGKETWFVSREGDALQLHHHGSSRVFVLRRR